MSLFLEAGICHLPKNTLKKKTKEKKEFYSKITQFFY